MLELRVGGLTVVRHEVFRHLCTRLRAARLVHDDVGRDREDPRAQPASVLQPRIGAQGAHERLLEGVVGALAAQPLDEEPEDLVPVLLVEALEGRYCVHRLPETYAMVKM